MNDADFFYVAQRFDNEIPCDVSVRTKEHNGHICPFGIGRVGIVVGHRYVPDAIVPTGWNYIRFDDDDVEYPDPSSMPYVHTDYLEVIP